ncbi:MAG: phage tail length tape measure family protein [Rhizobium sp.]|nr:phage tail length tape measure family protein [Rhizobium sp.]
MAEKTDDLIISISTDLATVRRSLKRLEADIGSTTNNVQKQFDTLGKGIDKSMTTAMQGRINAMTGVGAKAAKEWTGALAEQGKELERLRARYSPLFSTINNYKANITEIRRAHALGAISSAEYTAAMSRERQAALASINAIKGRNAAIADTPTAARNGGGAVNTANLAAQFQDIAVTSAMGMNPLQIALQQGTQISAVLGPMGAAGAVSSLGAAFMSIINPVSLATIGIVAAGAAAIQYFSGMNEDGAEAESLLKNHAELIRRIKETWPEAAAGLREYTAESSKVVKQETIDSVEAYRAKIMEVAAALRDDLRVPADIFEGATYVIGKMQSAMAELDEGIAAGNPDIQAFVDRMVDIENMSGAPEQVKALAKELRQSAASGIEAQRALEPLTGVISGVGAIAAAQVERVKALAQALRGLSGIAMPNLSELEQAAKIRDDALSGPAGATEGGVREIENAYQNAVRRYNNQNPTVTNVDGFTTGVPVPGNRPVTLGDVPSKGGGGGRSKRTTQDQFQADIQAIRDRTEAIRQEMQLVGLSDIEQEKRRVALDLEQRALKDLREAARQKGVTDLESIQLSPEKLAAIEAEAEAYAAATVELKGLEEQQAKLTERSEFFKGAIYDAFDALIPKIQTGNAALDQFLNTMIQAVAQAALLNTGPLAMAGGGAGLIGGLLGLFGLKDGGPVPAFAGGGRVSGPGGPRDDKVLMWGSNGEFMVNAKATKKHRALLEAINSGLPSFADGGSIGAPRMPSIVSRGGQRESSVHVTVGVSADNNGNLMPFVESVSERKVAAAAPRIVSASQQRVMPTIANYQQARAGGDYRG